MEHLMSVFSILKSNLVSLIIYQCMFHVLSWHSNGLAETRVALNLWVTVIIIFPIWLVILQVYQYIQLAISYTMYHIKSAIYPFVKKNYILKRHYWWFHQQLFHMAGCEIPEVSSINPEDILECRSPRIGLRENSRKHYWRYWFWGGRMESLRFGNQGFMWFFLQ